MDVHYREDVGIGLHQKLISLLKSESRGGNEPNSSSPKKENLPIFPQACLAFSKPSSGPRGISSPNMSLYALGFQMHPASSLQQTARKPGCGFERTRVLWREGTGATPAQREFGSGGSRSNWLFQCSGCCFKYPAFNIQGAFMFSCSAYIWNKGKQTEAVTALI